MNTCYTKSELSLSQHPFGMLLQGRIFGTEAYRFGFNRQEQDDEVYGNGNLNAAEFWEYDTRLGRRWNRDPKSFPYISVYATFENNPILNIDLLGDKIFNGHKDERDKAAKRLENAQNSLNDFGSNTKGKEYKNAQKELKKAQSSFNRIDLKFQAAEKAISDLQTYHPDLYNQLDNLTDPGDQVVDVYVHIEYDLHSDVVDPSVSNYASRVKLNGLTEVKVNDYVTVSDFSTGSVQQYASVKSTLHGANTITIFIDQNTNLGSTLAHEGGHTLYDAKHLLEYLNWLRLNPSKQGKGGHESGDPSGEEAFKQQEIYDKNKKNSK